MICARLSLAGIGLALAASLQAAELPPPGASACLGCHPAKARADAPVISLTGLPAAQIAARMLAWRNGAEPATVMNRIAKGFDEAQIAAIARYFGGHRSP